MHIYNYTIISKTCKRLLYLSINRDHFFLAVELLAQLLDRVWTPSFLSKLALNAGHFFLSAFILYNLLPCELFVSSMLSGVTSAVMTELERQSIGSGLLDLSLFRLNRKGASSESADMLVTLVSLEDNS